MKKSVILFVVLTVLVFSAEVFAGVIIAKKVDKIEINNDKRFSFSLYVGNWKVNYPIHSTGVAVFNDKNEITVYIKKAGEKCHPFYIIPRDLYSDIKKVVDFTDSQIEVSGFCADESVNKPIKEKKKKILNQI